MDGVLGLPISRWISWEPGNPKLAKAFLFPLRKKPRVHLAVSKCKGYLVSLNMEYSDGNNTGGHQTADRNLRFHESSDMPTGTNNISMKLQCRKRTGPLQALYGDNLRTIVPEDWRWRSLLGRKWLIEKGN